MEEYVARKYPYTTLMTGEFHPHRHSFWEGVITLEGEVVHTVNGIKYPLHAGEIMFMKPESTHDYKIKSERYSHYDFYSDADSMREAVDFAAPDLYVKIAAAKDPVIINGTSALSYLRDRLSLLNSLQLSKELSERKELVYRLLLQFFGGMIAENAEKSDIPEWLTTFLSALSSPDNLSRDIEDVAPLSGYSHGHLCKLFKKYTGETLAAYFIRLKIDRACTLLKSGERSSDVAAELGYDSLSHFSTVFKKYNGLTPSAFKVINKQ